MTGVMAVGSALMGAFDPAIQVGIFIGTFVTLAEILNLKKTPNPDKQTTLSLLVGNAPNSGGSVPHVAAWDGNGNRIGQYGGDANGHWEGGTANSILIDNTQNGVKAAQPEYLSIVMNEKDAICLSAVFANGDGATWGWTGDMGYACDAQWYASDYVMGNSNSAPRCVWLDSDGSNGIIASGLSIHIRDFTADSDLMNQYMDKQERLCQNSARMTFHNNLTPDGIPNFFHPPLKYTRQGDPNTDSGGGLQDPDQGIDRTRRAYEDGAPGMHTKRRLAARDLTGDGNSTGIVGIKNNRPGHLIISNLDHSAKELCEHHASLGPDFVSIKEGVYCDMETAKWWPLCQKPDDKGCFDLDKQVLRDSTSPLKFLKARSAQTDSKSKYATSAKWPSKK